MVNLPKVLRAPTLTDLAYLSLKQHLLHGKLVEGARLTEEALSTQLGISKSPVREALTRLESEGVDRDRSAAGSACAEIFDAGDARPLRSAGAAGSSCRGDREGEFGDAAADGGEHRADAALS